MIQSFPTRDTWAEAAADRLAGALAGALAANGRALFAGSGGSTPSPIYARLAQADLDWTKLSVIEETPDGWYVTGYPWSEIKTPEHAKFFAAYQAKFKDYPRLGSIVGYSTVMSAVAAIKKAGSLDQDKLIAAMAGLTHSTPFGEITYRPLDHQSTMGAYVGRLGVKDGKGYMKDWRFVDGKDALPSDAEVKKMRPAN